MKRIRYPLGKDERGKGKEGKKGKEKKGELKKDKETRKTGKKQHHSVEFLLNCNVQSTQSNLALE